MKRPSSLTRIAGAPFMAIVLLLGSAAAILGWYAGNVSGWLALGAAFTTMQTLSAVGTVGRYKAWSAEWTAMEKPLHPPQETAAKPRSRWKSIAFAVLLLLAIPQLLSQAGLDDGLGAALISVFVADILYLAYRLFATMRDRYPRAEVRSGTRRQAKADTAPAAWLLERASSSPSRAAAVRNLPEYSARLLSR